MTSTFQVYVVDPSLDSRQHDNEVIPLGAGVVAAYLRHHMPHIGVEVFKGVTPCVEAIEARPPNVIGFANYMWNTNICVAIAAHAREVEKDTLIVFGGPEIDSEPFDQAQFAKKYHMVDMFVQHEGERAFLEIVRKYLELGEDTSRLRDSIDELGNSFYLDESGGVVRGGKLPRITDLDEIPSPYLNGMFDKFLDDSAYLPMIQTNRGCPFACTFCQEGIEYFTEVKRHSLTYTVDELDYIAERVDPGNGLFITDSNWAMYKEDVDVAKHMAKCQETVNWPREIISSTGKANLKRIIEIAKMLNGAMFILNSVQSTSDDVLKTIRRKNLNKKELAENRGDLEGMRQEPEMIVPLPKETRESFLSGVDQLLDVETPQRFGVFQTLILSNTPLAEHASVAEHDMDVGYKQNRGIMGHVKGRFVCATERVVRRTATMSSQELCDVLTYTMVLDALLRFAPVPEVFYFLDSKHVQRSRLTRRMMDTIGSAAADVQMCVEGFQEDFLGEMFDTEEAAIEHAERHYADYVSGRKGGGNLKWSNKLWIDHFDGTMEWLFTALSEVVSASASGGPALREEIRTLRTYLLHVYYDRPDRNAESPETVQRTFDHDVQSWATARGKRPFGDFKGATEYAFDKTPVSGADDLTIWKSFGFKRDEGERYIDVLMNWLFLVRLRRNVRCTVGGQLASIEDENRLVGKLPLFN